MGLRQWATGPGRHRSGSSVESSKSGPREIPSRPGPGDGHGPHWVAARRPRASQSECSPARQAPDLPGHPLPARVAMVPRTAGCPGVVWPDPFERFPSFLWSLRASPLIFASRLSSPLRENPAETMTRLPGLRRFGFCGLQVAVLLRSVAGPVFPPPFAL